MKKKSLGLGFPDEISKGGTIFGHFKKGREYDWKDMFLPGYQSEQIQEKDNLRILFFGILTVCLFFILFLRLFHLQIVKGEENRIRAEGNRIKVKVIHAPRGVIFDRNGKLLAQNQAGFRIIDPQTAKATVLTREQALELEAINDPQAPLLEVDNIRSYPEGEQTAHVVGYVGEISQEQLRNEKYKKDYKIGDKLGISGVEASYEEYLRGIDGGEIIEVDAKGDTLRVLGTVHPTAGNNLVLSLDLGLQKIAFQSLIGVLQKVGSCCGAAIVSDPETGEILSLVSLPTFDPNIFETDDEKVEEILSAKNFPILNRAIGGVYSPGSTFKIVSSAAALASDKITPQTEVLDLGQIVISGQKFSNWYFTQYGKTEGSVNLVKALKRSTDTYFYWIGQTLGEGPLIDWARKFKMGTKLGIDIPGEVEGLVPDPAWKQKNQDLPWYPGDTLHLSIGQGFILTTPLQVQGLVSYVGGDGKLYKPHLLQNTNPKILIKDLISSKNLKVIKEGLEEVTRAGGTAWPFFNFPIKTAGKTGTAEYGDPKGRTHAWYTSFAPVDNPKIAVTVLVEGGGEGSSVAAPVVKEIMRYYFSEDKNNLIKDIYPVEK